MSKELADLLRNPKDKGEELKMLALMLANRALAVASETGAFTDEDGQLDYRKAIPTVPWVT